MSESRFKDWVVIRYFGNKLYSAIPFGKHNPEDLRVWLECVVRQNREQLIALIGPIDVNSTTVEVKWFNVKNENEKEANR